MNSSIPQQPPLEPPPPTEKRKPPAMLGCFSVLLAGFLAFAVIVGLTVLSTGLLHLTFALIAGVAFFAYAFFHYVVWGWWMGDMIRAEAEEEEEEEEGLTLLGVASARIGQLFRWAYMNPKRLAVIGVCLATLFGGYFLFGFVFSELPPGQYDVAIRSTNLVRDIELMWETKRLPSGDPTHGPNPHASTDRAINAASRVFNSISLNGKTSDEVIELLGDPKSSNNSIYNFPFWPAPPGGMVYRFDSGSYGWQFNVSRGGNHKVVSVERIWIH